MLAKGKNASMIFVKEIYVVGAEQRTPEESRTPFGLVELMRSLINRVRDQRVIAEAGLVLDQKQPIPFKLITGFEFITVDHGADGGCSVSYEEIIDADNSVYTRVEILTDYEPGAITGVSATRQYLDYH